MKKIQKKYTFAVIASDVVIFTIRENKLNVLLIKMQKEPFKENYWAAPGGLIKPSESVETSAQRNLFEKTGVRNVYLEQLYTFGDIDRDPFGRVVSVAYFALIPSDAIRLKTTKEYGDVQWFEIDRLPKLAYDHKQIIATACERLQKKLEYSNIAYSLLPKKFPLSELQRTYEIILKKRLDKRNFRKKIFSLGLVIKTNTTEKLININKCKSAANQKLLFRKNLNNALCIKYIHYFSRF